MQSGVGPSWVALPGERWPSLIDFLVHRFAHVARDEWLHRLRSGDVWWVDGTPAAPDAPFRPHAKVFYYRRVRGEQPIPFEERVLFQDDHLVVADKPHFLPVVPSGRYLQHTLLVRLKRRLGIETLAPLHRIDRETAGLVLFSVKPATRAAYHGLFRDRQIRKVYEAIAPVHPALETPFICSTRLEDGNLFMSVNAVSGAPNAHTHIERLEAGAFWARYRLTPSTGRRHQLRVQMAALGAPIANDTLYPTLQPHSDVPDYSRPLQLLARELSFIDPISGAARRFESRLRLDQPV